MMDNGTDERTVEPYCWWNAAALTLPLRRVLSRLEVRPDTSVVLRHLFGTRGADSGRLILEWIVPERLPSDIDLTGDLPLLDALDHVGAAWNDSESIGDVSPFTEHDGKSDNNEPSRPPGRAETYLIHLVDSERQLAVITYVDHDDISATLNEGILSYIRPRSARRPTPPSK